MLHIQVASLPLKEVIRDMAESFKTTYKENFGEYILTLPSQIGEGTIRGVNFDGGLGIIQYDCKFFQDTKIQFIVNKVHPLKFVYVIKGTLHHKFENEDALHTVNQYQNAIIASSDKNGHIINFKKDVSTCIYSLEIDRKEFEKKLSHHHDGLNVKLKKVFQDIKAQKSFYYEGDYSLKMADVFKKIQNFDSSDFLHMIFMESMAYQTLVLQISQFIDDQNQKKNRTVLRRTEIENVVKASTFVEDHLSTYKSILDLTKLTGLNAAKLQEGFKYLHNTTVNQFVFEARLNLAKELLINTDDSISEIVYKIGLSSKSYFSRVFKEEYGMQPSNFRKTLEK